MHVAALRHERDDAEDAQQTDRQVDVEDPAPAVVFGQPAAQHRPHDRAENRAHPEHRHRRAVPLRRVDAQERRLRQRDQPGAGHPLKGPEHHQFAEARRDPAQRRGDREANHRAEKDVFDPEAPGHPPGQRHHHRGADDIRGQRPGDLVLRRRQAALHMRQCDVEDRIVDPLHDVGEHDRQRQHAAMRHDHCRTSRLPAPHRPRSAGKLPSAFSGTERPHAASACSTVGASPATVVRRMSRTRLSSKRRTRCMTWRLSHITRSRCRHLCE